jgi:hypothetical protein
MTTRERDSRWVAAVTLVAILAPRLPSGGASVLAAAPGGSADVVAGVDAV